MDFDFWIDADSVPRQERQILLKAAKRTGMKAFFVADRSLPDVVQFIATHTASLRDLMREKGVTDKDELKTVKSSIQMITVSQGADSADDLIAQNAQNPSLCITHDIILASRLLEKGLTVIDDRGGQYTQRDISSRLGNRLINKEMREMGLFAEQQSSIGKKESGKFAATLDAQITQLLASK